MALPHFLKKWFQLRHSKISKKLKNALFKHSEHLFLSSRYLQNIFLRSSLWPTFDLKFFERFASLSQKMFSPSPLKNLLKCEKCSFRMLRTVVYELKVTSSYFANKVGMTKCWIKKVLSALPDFTRKSFQLHHSKTSKNLKNALFKCS